MYLNPANETVRKRQEIEVAIVTKVVDDALKAGYILDVDDGGGGIALRRSRDRKAVLDALMNTDDDSLHLRRFNSDGAQVEHGWVRFVYGNDGWDVISDYSLNIEDVLAGANKLAEELEGRA